jgi:hypothetical protein
MGYPDSPVISRLSAAEIAHVYEICNLTEIDEDAADTNKIDYDEVQVMLKDIRNSVRICHEAQLDFVSFAH